MSTKVLVIAPRPKVEASADTVGPWHTRACASVATMPSERIHFWVRMPVSFDEAEAVSMPKVGRRCTGTPFSFCTIRLASRSVLMWRAMRLSASCQEMRFHSLLPGSRTSGKCRRFLLWIKSSSEAPFGHKEPRLTG